MAEQSKRTKRCSSTKELSLEDHISAHRARLIKEREDVPNLLQSASDYKLRADACIHAWQQRIKNGYLRRAKEIEEECKIRYDMTREHEFESKVVTYLRKYHTQCTRKDYECKNDSIAAFIRQNDASQKLRCSLLDEFLVETNDAQPKVIMASRDECPKCQTKLLLCEKRSSLLCRDCGYSMAYLDATSTSTAFDDIVEYSQYSYKRINHYLMWIALVQGKETHKVSQDILDAVMEELYHKHGVRDNKSITTKLVREVLRQKKLRKGYDHVAQITYRISGIRPPRISLQTEEERSN